MFGVVAALSLGARGVENQELVAERERQVRNQITLTSIG